MHLYYISGMEYTLFDILEGCGGEGPPLGSSGRARGTAASVADNLARGCNSRHGLAAPESRIGLPDVGDARRCGSRGIARLGVAVRDLVLASEPRLRDPVVTFVRHDPGAGRLLFQLRGILGMRSAVFEIALRDPGPMSVTYSGEGEV